MTKSRFTIASTSGPMIKKLFSLVSVTALTGLVVAASATACSGTATYFYGDEGGIEGGKVGTNPNPGATSTPTDPPPPPLGKDAGKPPPKDSSPPDPPDPPAICPTTDPITAADVDAQLAWKAPSPFQNVCTQANIDDLKALFAGAGAGGVKYADIKTALGSACAGCTFSPIKGANWQVFVEEVGGAVDNSAGSCFAQRSNATCGQARFRWDECLALACDPADCGGTPLATCAQKAQKGACKTLTNAYVAACPNEVDLIAGCGTFYDSIATNCAGGPGHTINTK